MSLLEGTATANINNLIDSMKTTKEEINSIELATKHQSEAPEWFKYVGGIIAYNAERIYTCHQRLFKKLNSCIKLVVSLTMHYDNFNPNTVLKHCLAMEIHAKQKYPSL